MTRTEKLILNMLNEIFWMLSDVPGVSIDVDQVRFFNDADTLVNPENKEVNDKITASYE